MNPIIDFLARFLLHLAFYGSPENAMRVRMERESDYIGFLSLHRESSIKKNIFRNET
jgi:hypothetical protein